MEPLMILTKYVAFFSFILKVYYGTSKPYRGEGGSAEVWTMSKVLHFLFFEAFPYSYLEFHLYQIRGQQDIGLDIQAQGLVSSVSQPPKYSSGLNPKIVE